MQSVQTQQAVETRIRHFKCKATKPMIKVWQVQAATCSLIWMGSQFKAYTAAISSKLSVPTTSRRSSRQEKLWQLTRLRRLTAHESLFLPLNSQIVPITWIVWANKVMLVAQAFRTLFSLTIINLTRVDQQSRTTIRQWSIAAWTISSWWTTALLRSVLPSLVLGLSPRQVLWANRTLEM